MTNKQTLKDQLPKIKCIEHERQIVQIGLDQNLLPSQRALCEVCGQKAIMVPISIDRAIVMIRMIQNDEDIVQDQAMVSMIDQCLNGGDRALTVKDIITIGTVLSNKFIKIGDNFIEPNLIHRNHSRIRENQIKKQHQLIGNQSIVIKESTKYEAKTGIEWIKNIIETEHSQSSFISSSFSPIIKVWSGGKFKELKHENQFVRCVTLFDEELIVCYADSSIRIWKQKDGSEWTVDQTLKEQHQGEIWSVITHFETFVTGSYDKSLKVFSKRRNNRLHQNYKCIQKVDINDCQVTCMAIHDDILGIGSRSGSLAICQFTDVWNLTQILSKHTAAIQCVAFKADQKLLATGSDDKSILLWEMKNGDQFELIQEIKDHQSYVFSLAFHPTYAAFLSGGLDNKMMLFGLDSKGRWIKFQELNKDNPITVIQFLKDNWKFYIGTSVGTIILHEIEQQQQ
ncbi:unnamed protein product (macronuclear) [Paramecium tetraurelia]|uniref:Vps41 beta-propeller domain-containing protein n=1 Tax=Paramecium tetraurelia TaxID=5888 RepID=A0CY76_PARTE|nr:uncharacterized protein GSPATT00039081001 [Paramecium tetraurelia]CAK75743.1 unnamed protein product [Paramecium tetraurelia]|eukprot:XP_001443140.1 hypothetical protein (macronuclear) [Paramecium tetraurelia strain d4-2]